MDLAAIPLGENLTLNLPFSVDLEVDCLDLDQDQINKLNILRNTFATLYFKTKDWTEQWIQTILHRIQILLEFDLYRNIS